MEHWYIVLVSVLITWHGEGLKNEETNLKVSGVLYFTLGGGKIKNVKNGAKTELAFEFKHKIYNSLKVEEKKSTM